MLFAQMTTNEAVGILGAIFLLIVGIFALIGSVMMFWSTRRFWHGDKADLVMWWGFPIMVALLGLFSMGVGLIVLTLK